MRQYGHPTSIDKTIRLLAATELLQGLDDTALRTIATGVEHVELLSGETLMREGDRGDDVYVVVSGRLRTFVSTERSPIVGEIGATEIVGEMAILAGTPRSATVRAVRDSHLIRLPAAIFDRLLAIYPQAMRHLARVLVLRLHERDRTQRADAIPATIAVAPAGEDNTAVTDFARRVTEGLSAVSSTIHLSSRVVADVLGHGRAQLAADDPRHGEVIGWLNELERQHRFLVYECDGALSEWSRRCLRQADRIVLVATHAGSAALNDVEAHLFTSADVSVPTDLVLLYNHVGARPRDTARWLTNRRLRAHYHVVPSSAADIERLVRCVLGRAIGVALSGGGARGFAQIGILRALREHGAPIDVIGGTSQGAIIGALHAAGHDYRAMIDLCRKGFLDIGLHPLRDFTLPLVSLFDGRHAVKALRSMFGDARIEDLWTPYFCISTNLTRARIVVHRSGLLHRYLRASGGIPGFFPPFPADGDLLVDGGLVNNMPADIVRRLGAETVIAVDTMASDDLTTDMGDFDALSGWRLAGARFNPYRRRPRIPSIMDVLTRCVMLSGVYYRESLERSATYCLRPPVGQIPFMDWRSLEHAAEVGYRYAVEQIATWPKLGKLPAV